MREFPLARSLALADSNLVLIWRQSKRGEEESCWQETRAAGSCVGDFAGLAQKCRFNHERESATEASSLSDCQILQLERAPTEAREAARLQIVGTRQ